MSELTAFAIKQSRIAVTPLVLKENNCITYMILIERSCSYSQSRIIILLV